MSLGNWLVKSRRPALPLDAHQNTITNLILMGEGHADTALMLDAGARKHFFLDFVLWNRTNKNTHTFVRAVEWTFFFFRVQREKRWVLPTVLLARRRTQ